MLLIPIIKEENKVKLKMKQDQPVSNDGIEVIRLKKDQIVESPKEITDEIFQILIVNNLATLIEEEEKKPLTGFTSKEVTDSEVDEDTEIIDEDDEEIEDVSQEPEVVKKLTEKPLFNKYAYNNKSRGKNKRWGKWVS